MVGKMLRASLYARLSRTLALLLDGGVPLAELMETVRSLAEKLAAGAPSALAAVKRAINEGIEMPLEAGCALEAQCFGELCETRDMKEGAAAFLEKRKASFTGT